MAVNYNDIRKKLSVLGGESTQHDKVYDAVNALEKGKGTYDDIYKAMNEPGVESTQYDAIYDELRKGQREDLLQYHNPEETQKIMNGAVTKAPSSGAGSAPSQNVSNAMALLSELRKQQYADPYGKQLESLINSWNSREPFSYELENDPLFQMARDNAMYMGDRAMRDTMGKAAAMSGGYSNSYAQTAGQQAYNAYLQELNSQAPDFYAAAYEKYKDEDTRLLNEINNVNTLRKNDYSLWEDAYKRELDAVGAALSSENEAGKLAWEQSKWLAEQEIKNNQWEMGFLKDLGYDFYLDENGNLRHSGTIAKTTDGKTVTLPGASAEYEDIPVEEKHMKDALNAYMNGGVSGLDYYISQLSASTAGDYKGQYLDNVKNAVHTTNLFGKVANNTSPRWSVIEDGGRNWGSGINNNTVVRYTNEDGTTEDYRLDELKDKLIEQGASEAMAKSVIVNLQRQLNIRKKLPDESD